MSTFYLLVFLAAIMSIAVMTTFVVYLFYLLGAWWATVIGLVFLWVVLCNAIHDARTHSWLM